MAEELATKQQLQDSVEDVLSRINNHITSQDAAYKRVQEVFAGVEHLPQVTEAIAALYESIKLRSEFHCEIQKQILGILKDILETRG